MFTGIVQEVGKIRDRVAADASIRFFVETPSLGSKLRIGDSVACDGVCLTVERSDASGFSACAVPETLAKTTLASWQPGDSINLEAAATASTPLGGHFVLGHVDGACELIAIRDNAGDGGREITVKLPAEFLPFCVSKGSLTLAGVSLTIAGIEGGLLRFALVPHTLSATNLAAAAPGARLNFEVDVLAKYVRQFAANAAADPTEASAPVAAPPLDLATLEKWGYGAA